MHNILYIFIEKRDWGRREMQKRDVIKFCNRIVVKVGTSTLTHENGKINYTRMEKLARVLSDLMNAGKEIVLVSSGAIGVGVNKLKLKHPPKLVREKQAVAAVGQCELMHIYSKLFGEYNYVVGQVLLTRDVVEDKHVRQNVVNTFETLLENKIIPIVNENDTVAIDEIENIVRFGDNDNLSAIVGELVGADLLVMLSDIDGLYDSDPRCNPDSKLMEVVGDITSDVEGCAGGAGSSMGTGGMVTKIMAAKRAAAAGAYTVIANGQEPNVLFAILAGENIGTLFLPK